VRHSFRYNPYGKPFLNGNDFLRFNVSHSGGEALYGVTLGRAIGIDIERIRRLEHAAQIVESFFSDIEKDIFRGLPQHRRIRSFYNCWTRKEAYVKALGKGMSLPLNEFSVSFLPGEPAGFIPHKTNSKKQDFLWTLKEIVSKTGYAAAVAVRGVGLCFRQWRWSW
jgi:4'-phosphopantetheinyl transferase